MNKHLNSKMKGLTAKVFRTFNASITFQRLLDGESLEDATLQEKLNAYNKANRNVAILCNHQRSVPKTHGQSMEKMRYKVSQPLANEVWANCVPAPWSEVRTNEVEARLVHDGCQVQKEQKILSTRI